MKQILVATLIGGLILLLLWNGFIMAMFDTYNVFRVAGIVATVLFIEYPLTSGIILSFLVSFFMALITRFFKNI